MSCNPPIEALGCPANLQGYRYVGQEEYERVSGMARNGGALGFYCASLAL
jgi:hypothetical protein